MIRKMIWGVGTTLGGLLVILVAHLTGGEGDAPDVSKLPYCTATQTAADGCIPEEYENIQKQQQQVEDLAGDLDNT